MQWLPSTQGGSCNDIWTLRRSGFLESKKPHSDIVTSNIAILLRQTLRSSRIYTSNAVINMFCDLIGDELALYAAEVFSLAQKKQNVNRKK